jgi:cytochrome P450
VSDDVEGLDFFRDERLLDDPYPFLDALRARCPVERETHHDVVMVTGYDEALSVLQDPERFSSCISVTGPFPGFPVPLDGLDGDRVSSLIEQHRSELPFSDQLPTLDPPTHTAHRGLMMKLLTPKRLKENEGRMWELADRQLDTFLEGRRAEFIAGFAQPFTMLVIADLLGVPEEDQAEFLAAGLRPSGGGIGSTGDDELAHSPLEFLYERFRGYIEDRRRSPREDVLTGMALATFPDGSMPDVMDVVRVATNVFSAGQETTVRLLGSAVKVLAEQPELQAALRDDPTRIPNFVEESLRTESPVKGDFRLAKVPVTVGGVDLPAGTTVMLVNAAANRDPRKFADPGAFDPDRANARHHMAFGRGIHTCPGAPLARAEARTGIERLLRRTAAIRISDAEHGPAGARRYDYVPTFILRGLTRLHLEFEPAAGDAR